MKQELFIVIKGAINSRELYRRIAHYEPSVTDMDTETYVAAATDISEHDADNIVAICKEYGECDITRKNAPIF